MAWILRCESRADCLASDRGRSNMKSLFLGGGRALSCSELSVHVSRKPAGSLALARTFRPRSFQYFFEFQPPFLELSTLDNCRKLNHVTRFGGTMALSFPSFVIIASTLSRCPRRSVSNGPSKHFARELLWRSSISVLVSRILQRRQTLAPTSAPLRSPRPASSSAASRPPAERTAARNAKCVLSGTDAASDPP